MAVPSILDIRPRVAEALRAQTPVVALESTLIAHGLPWPVNLETARAAEDAVRAEGAVPATIAIFRGRPVIGLVEKELEQLAREGNILKASSRDLAAAIAQGRTASTTVAATMRLAYQAGIRLFATGGIGGAHRASDSTSAWDISADLVELSRTAVAVVCAGPKNVLDIPRTLEILETFSVPLLGYGTSDVPAFYVRSSGIHASARVDTPHQAGACLDAHWQLGGAGVVIAQPVVASAALDADDFAAALNQAEELAARQNIHGPELTPFLLARLAEITDGRTLRANQALIIANAQLAARIAVALTEGSSNWTM